mmetsp:Transcript_15421/g.23190  ORF Transcript_15421/g.23190 Transcript_15421/m.23190 type:complete len:1435 (-) Transcript_15421:1365-5669(-)
MMTDRATEVCVGILRFDDRNRYGGEHGVPTTLLFGGKKRWIVECKKRTKLNQWCKVRVPIDKDASHKGELVEILGPIGDRSIELKALQLHFSILPCRYPKKESWDLIENKKDERELVHARVFSVDNAGTRDIDDALSFEIKEDTKVLGIHVADVASRIAVNSVLFSWAQERASSAYSMEHSVPMLPPELAHDELSLNQGVERNAISLFLEIGPNLEILNKRHARTIIINNDATTYARFGDDELQDEYLVECRTLLRALSNQFDAEDLVAWTMVEYNRYFGEILAQSTGLGLLRAQPIAGLSASYVSSDMDPAAHIGLGLAHYAHCSSPIRRFCDLANQHVLFSRDKLHAAEFWQNAKQNLSKNIHCLNDRCREIKQYHANVDAMELAYECRGAAQQFESLIELGEEYASLLVHTPKRRVRVPLHDSYFAEPITAAIRRAVENEDQSVRLELCGVLLSGRTRLRARLVSSSSSILPLGFRGAKNIEPKNTIAKWLKAAELAIQDRLDEEDDLTDDDEKNTVTLQEEEGGALQESYVNQILGYGIDDFQKRCLRVIVEPGLDLLAMAPTGSGKTAVALMAILQAFARGQRAAYTSPIKALSNQKYAEFTEWFRGRGIDAHVTLLTGDVKIRAPPGTQRELMICTSEILRNKLVKASGGSGILTITAAAKAAAEAGDQEAARALEIMAREGHTEDADPDLERLGCVVSDEIHYINDVDRGAVWEETLMHMPKQVQMVALSATLKDPEYFLEWIKRVRDRDGRLVVRKDRHVPLHFGGIDAKTGEFRELYCTHDDPTTGKRGGKFEVDGYSKLFSKEALSTRLQDDEKRLAAKQAARAERNAEHDARQQAMGGSGHKPKKKPAAVKPGSASQHHNKEPNFVHECLKLARALDKADKLPGIVFCMSRKLCVQGAHACQSLNLLLGEKPKKKKNIDQEEGEDNEEEEEEEKKRKARISEIERKRRVMHQKHLARYMPELGELEAYRDIEFLLSRGVAYHHSGMLPILREYVELCFQQRLVRLVFATETLAVGVNMPARCVAFTQLDKPDDTGAKQGHRWLRVDEFWQMAGRAGRRGLDTVGYVIYAPTLSVAGLRNVVPVHELNRMLTGSVAPATSQLEVDRPFVLRHMARGHDHNVLTKTLRADELRRENDFARRKLEEIEKQQANDRGLESLAPLFARYEQIEQLLQPATVMIARAKISQKEIKKLQREKRDILDKYPRFFELREKAQQDTAARNEIRVKEAQLKNDWDQAYNWLVEAGFIIPPSTLTPRGKCAAAFSDGEPLILGTMIADEALYGLSLPEVSAWLCLFIPNRTTDKSNADFLLASLSQPSAALVDVFDYADELSEQLDKEKPDRILALLVLEWVKTKDIKVIAKLVDPHLLGSFVKVIMRLLSYIDVVREVLLGLGQYEIHNRLDNHADGLLAGLVTNESLYLRIDS